MWHIFDFKYELHRVRTRPGKSWKNTISISSTGMFWKNRLCPGKIKFVLEKIFFEFIFAIFMDCRREPCLVPAHCSLLMLIALQHDDRGPVTALAKFPPVAVLFVQTCLHYTLSVVNYDLGLQTTRLRMLASYYENSRFSATHLDNQYFFNHMSYHKLGQLIRVWAMDIYTGVRPQHKCVLFCQMF